MAYEKIFVKPAEGLIIRDPKTYAILPVDGAFVEGNVYWHRRIADGDVIQGSEVKKKKDKSKS